MVCVPGRNRSDRLAASAMPVAHGVCGLVDWCTPRVTRESDLLARPGDGQSNLVPKLL